MKKFDEAETNDPPENPDSLVYKFLKLQLKNPTRGDWASSCLKDLQELQINLSFEEIEMLSKKQFNTMVKESIKKKSFGIFIK